MLSLVTGGKLPKEELTECALPGRDVCVDTKDIKYMHEFLRYVTPDGDKKKLSDKETVERLKRILNVNSEAEIWEHSKFRKFVGDDKAALILEKNYIPEGPGLSTALLNNENIDDSLELWALNGKERFQKKFYHIPYQMIDFERKKTELALLNIPDLIQQKYDCFGVILNTDYSDGKGKHWFCLFGDLMHKGTSADPIRLEYFNSSGNSPLPEVAVWLEKTKHNLLRDNGIHTEIVYSARQRLQHSQTECGVWSLLYIKSRLEGHPPGWFYKVQADDADMIEYRQHLFRVKTDPQ